MRHVLNSISNIAELSSSAGSYKLSEMEESARRRLESIARHLLLETGAPHLRPNPVGSTEPISTPPSSPVVIGGMVLDIIAKPRIEAVPGSTTPGTVQYVSGGVARNVAECMSKLGSKPFLISVVGLDMAGELLLKYWESAGLSTQGVLKIQGITTPVVSNIFDCSGELAVGVASVEAVETLVTPGWIRQFSQYLCHTPMLMVDANLHPQTLKVACQIAAESGTPVWFEPVSVTKSTRIASVIDYVTCTSPNVNELMAMANALSAEGEFCTVQWETAEAEKQSISSFFLMLKPAISLLLEKGIELLVVTLGPNGVFLCFKHCLSFMKDSLKTTRITRFGRQLYELVNQHCPPKQDTSSFGSGEKYSHTCAFHFSSLPASVVSVTGAGDCLVGGILASISAGLDVMQSTAVGIAVAKAAVESEFNVPAEYSLTTIAAEAHKIFLSATQLVLD